MELISRFHSSHRARCFDHALINPALSLTSRPTLFTFPNRASASAIFCKSFLSAGLLLSPSSEPKSVSELLAVSSNWVVLYTLSAIRTRIQCVGLLSKFQRNVRYVPGTGVVISCGVYLRLVGKIFAVSGVVSKELLKGSIPLPFVVVHSGNTATTRSGF